MARSPDIAPEDTLGDANLPQSVSVRGWLAVYGVLFLAAAVPLALMIREDPGPFWDMLMATGRIFKSFAKLNHFHEFLAAITAAGGQFADALARADWLPKFLFMMLYLSLCTTFIPLPTGFMVSLMATGAGIAGNRLAGFALICAGGAAASTVANLNDYHVFLLLLRYRRIAKVRHTRTYRAAARWFDKGPFSIMVIFNIVHIPVDVVRMLSAIYGYHRAKFAAANFIGRFVRYATFFFITVAIGREYEWVAPLAFLGLAVLIALSKIAPAVWRRFFANKPAEEVSQ
ncbi:MAG: hypothetical protein ACE15C_17685 [Phycisphaerae bacterium]